MRLFSSYSLLSRWVVAACLLLAFVPNFTAQESVHVVKPVAAAGPVTPEEMQSRMEEAAVEFESLAPLPRIGFFDVAHPSSLDEYVELAGNAVTLVTVFVQDKGELPLKRVYLNLPGGEEVELKLLTSMQSKQTETGTKVSKTFGAHRLDALYLVPLHLNFREANLMIDFNKSRNGFRLGSIHGSTFVLKEKLPDKSLAETPSESALQKFIEREYPGFLKK